MEEDRVVQEDRASDCQDVQVACGVRGAREADLVDPDHGGVAAQAVPEDLEALVRGAHGVHGSHTRASDPPSWVESAPDLDGQALPFLHDKRVHDHGRGVSARPCTRRGKCHRTHCWAIDSQSHSSRPRPPPPVPEERGGRGRCFQRGTWRTRQGGLLRVPPEVQWSQLVGRVPQRLKT